MLRPFIANVSNQRLAAMFDKVLLHRQVPGIGLQHGSDRLVAHRHDLLGNPQATSELRGNLGERHAFPQELGTPDMRRQVPIPQAEPSLCPITPQHLQGMKSFLGQTPSGLGIGQARQSIHHCIQVRGDVQPVETFVITGVNHDGELIRRKGTGQPQDQFGPAHAARKSQHLTIHKKVSTLQCAEKTGH